MKQTYDAEEDVKGEADGLDASGAEREAHEEADLCDEGLHPAHVVEQASYSSYVDDQRQCLQEYKNTVRLFHSKAKPAVC